MKDFRKWLANKLAGLARRIYPESEEAMAFMADRMVDLVMTGQSTIKITTLDPEDTRLIHSNLWDLYEQAHVGPMMRWNPNTSRMEPYNAMDDLGMSKKP